MKTTTAPASAFPLPANEKLPITNYQLQIPGPEEPQTLSVPPSTINHQPSTLHTALALLDTLDSSSPPRPPTVLAVFRLYCVQNLTVAQVARACRCSVGTVCNRLKLLRAKTGLTPARLRSADGPAARTRGRPKRPQPAI